MAVEEEGPLQAGPKGKRFCWFWSGVECLSQELGLEEVLAWGRCLEAEAVRGEGAAAWACEEEVLSLAAWASVAGLVGVETGSW